MKTLVILSVIATVLAAPTEKDAKSLDGAHFTALHRNEPVILEQSIASLPTSVAIGQAVSDSAAVSVPGLTAFRAGVPTVTGFHTQGHAAVPFHGQHFAAVAGATEVIGSQAYGHAVAALPALSTYKAEGHAVVGANLIQPVATGAVSHSVVGAVAQPALTSFRQTVAQPIAVAQPVAVAQAVQVAQPAVATYHHTVAQPVAVAQPTIVAQQVTPIEYKAVPIAPKEVKVPITRAHVEVPIHQKVHYGVQQYVAGHQTQVHKPSLSAPAIAPPAVFKQKVTHHAPEVTVQHKDYPVVKSVPEFVEKPYHAGNIVEYTEPEIQQVDVPTPYKVPVPHPVPVVQEVQHVAQQYAVQAASIPVVAQQHVVQTAAQAIPVATAQFTQQQAVVGPTYAVESAVPLVGQQHAVVSQAAVPVVGQQYAAQVAVPALAQQHAVVSQAAVPVVGQQYAAQLAVPVVGQQQAVLSQGAVPILGQQYAVQSGVESFVPTVHQNAVLSQAAIPATLGQQYTVQGAIPLGTQLFGTQSIVNAPVEQTLDEATIAA